MNNRLLIAVALTILAAVYLLQRFSYAAMLNAVLPDAIHIHHPNIIFIVNKTIRLLLNDLACLLLIHSLFKSAPLLKTAFYLFMIELCIILPLYFIIKLNLEGDSEISSPLLSQIHRLVVNPLLMFLLIAGFLIQRLKYGKS